MSQIWVYPFYSFLISFSSLISYFCDTHLAKTQAWINATVHSMDNRTCHTKTDLRRGGRPRCVVSQAHSQHTLATPRMCLYEQSPLFSPLFLLKAFHYFRFPTPPSLTWLFAASLSSYFTKKLETTRQELSQSLAGKTFTLTPFLIILYASPIMTTDSSRSNSIFHPHSGFQPLFYIPSFSCLFYFSSSNSIYPWRIQIHLIHSDFVENI